MKYCIEYIQYLRFKICMFGVPFAGERTSTYVWCDNENVVKNSSYLDSMLNKNHSEIAFNFTRWNMAAAVFTVAWIPTGENIADAMTKQLSEITRDYFFGNWTY